MAEMACVWLHIRWALPTHPTLLWGDPLLRSLFDIIISLITHDAEGCINAQKTSVNHETVTRILIIPGNLHQAPGGQWWTHLLCTNKEEKRRERRPLFITPQTQAANSYELKTIIKSSWKNILKTFILAAQHKVGQKIKYTFSLDSCTLANRGKREIGVKPRILGVKEHLHLWPWQVTELFFFVVFFLNQTHN